MMYIYSFFFLSQYALVTLSLFFKCHFFFLQKVYSFYHITLSQKRYISRYLLIRAVLLFGSMTLLSRVKSITPHNTMWVNVAFCSKQENGLMTLLSRSHFCHNFRENALRQCPLTSSICVPAFDFLSGDSSFEWWNNLTMRLFCFFVFVLEGAGGWCKIRCPKHSSRKEQSFKLKLIPSRLHQLNLNSSDDFY